MMAHFTCKIGLPDGSIRIRELEGESPGQLELLLAESGCQLLAARRRHLGFLFGAGPSGSRLSHADLLSFNQELLVLLKAGMPLLQTLDTLLEQVRGKGKVAAVLTEVREEIKGGSSLSDAMEHQGRAFPQLCIALFRSGERTGDLVITIRRYIAFLKRSDQVRKRVVSSLFYPVILLVVASLAVSLLLLYVVPTFSRIYADAGSQLPLATRLLIDATTALRTLLPFLAGATLVVVWLFRRWSNTPAGRYRIDDLRLRVPLIGTLYRHYALSLFTRTITTLLGSGTPLVESLRNAAGTLHNRFMETRMLRVVRLVEEGSTLVAALEQARVMPLMALRMLGAGEATGALEELFGEIADYLEQDVEERLNLLTTAMEPAIMILMGALVGGIIIAMYLPIFKIAGTAG